MTPLLTVPPAPQRVFSFFARSATLSSFSSRPATSVTVFPARPDELRETRTRWRFFGEGAAFEHAHLSAGHPHFAQRSADPPDRPGPDE
jgi:hypothetical protein